MSLAAKKTTKELNCCRLCGGNTREEFQLLLLNKYNIAYYKCTDCASLQTEVPFWLNEAYTSNLTHLDTGAAQRNLNNLAASFAVSKLLKFNNVLDYGGGDGLLCRLLRDHGINCYSVDKYARPTYAAAFTNPNFEHPDLLLSFEVLEHFPNPSTDLEDLFSFNPKAIFVSTLLYSGEGPDWWYLAPETGQHIFFYSEAGIKYLAERYGYRVFFFDTYFLFIKPEYYEYWNITRLKFALRGRVQKFIKLLLCISSESGSKADFDNLRSAINKQTQ